MAGQWRCENYHRRNKGNIRGWLFSIRKFYIDFVGIFKAVLSLTNSDVLISRGTEPVNHYNTHMDIDAFVIVIIDHKYIDFTVRAVAGGNGA